MFRTLLVLLAIWGGCTDCRALPAPHSLVVGEGFKNPIGFYSDSPEFSWKLPEGVTAQTAYHVAVAGSPDMLPDHPDLWDSGRVDTDQSVRVEYKGKCLDSRQRIFWCVRFWDQSGAASAWSTPAVCEAGLLAAKDWSAQWISAPASSADDCRLVKAVYRSRKNPDRSRDVTALLQKQGTAVSLPVSNDALGGDPAHGEQKELVLAYRVGDREKTAVFNEGTKITLPPSGINEEALPMFRREFSVSGKVTRARLYVTARGLFEAYLNGEKVGNDCLVPGWTSYAKRIDTMTYDISDQVRQGRNAIGAVVGSGWYAGRIAYLARRKLTGRCPELLLQVEITYSDGRTETLCSDKHWKCSRNGPFRSSDIYDGEVYDARREMPGWDQAGFDETGWSDVEVNRSLGSEQLAPKPFAPVRVTDILHPVLISEPAPGRYVFDMGQNMAGWAMLQNVPVQAGQPVVLRFAEMLNPDGTMYTKNYRSAKSTDIYIPAESKKISWKPAFTYHGFRYVELSGILAGSVPEPDWVKGLVLHSDLPKVGTFTSSSPKLNRLQQNITWGQRSNFMEIPTDCPQRDERFGWTGDARVFCPTALFNYDCLAFFKSWLGTMREDQMPDGRIPNIVPDVSGTGGSPGWMDAATMVPWEVYIHSGEAGILSENYTMMQRLVSWYRRQADDGLIRRSFGFGDWLQPYASQGDTPKPLIATAFYARSVQILSKVSLILGKTAEAVRYESEFMNIKQAFAAHYFDEDGKLKNIGAEPQTAYLLAIEFDLLPSGLQSKAARHLTERVHAA